VAPRGTYGPLDRPPAPFCAGRSGCRCALFQVHYPLHGLVLAMTGIMAINYSPGLISHESHIFIYITYHPFHPPLGVRAAGGPPPSPLALATRCGGWVACWHWHWHWHWHPMGWSFCVLVLVLGGFLRLAADWGCFRFGVWRLAFGAASCSWTCCGFCGLNSSQISQRAASEAKFACLRSALLASNQQKPLTYWPVIK
jgi:hypothetical protein